eukprot:134475-Rhodomonas_salina.1
MVGSQSGSSREGPVGKRHWGDGTSGRSKSGGLAVAESQSVPSVSLRKRRACGAKATRERIPLR